MGSVFYMGLCIIHDILLFSKSDKIVMLNWLIQAKWTNCNIQAVLNMCVCGHLDPENAS